MEYHVGYCQNRHGVMADRVSWFHVTDVVMPLVIIFTWNTTSVMVKTDVVYPLPCQFWP